MKRSVSPLLMAIGTAFIAFLPAEAGNVSISNGRTTPVETATADGSSPGDVTITGNGSVKVSTGPAVTLNSDNAVINQGTIQVTNDTNDIGVLLEAGHTGSLTNSGTINALVEDADGIATGSGNIAIYVSGNGAFIGNLTFASGSKVEAGGTDAFAIRLDSNLQGTIDFAGAVTADGTDATGFASNGLITGNLTIESGATLTVTGDGARAALIAGGIDGAFISSGTISVTSPQTNVTYSGSSPRAAYALGIGGSLSEGFENIGTVSAVSAGQAALITPELGTQLADVTLGIIDPTATPYGLANTGTIVASTARDGETVTGLLVEGLSDGVNDYRVTIAGGIENSGSITSTTSTDGTAIGVELGNLATTPTLVNSGTISGVASSSNSAAAFGLLLDSGANLPSLTNSGKISGSVSSINAFAYGIVDRSGTLLTITNTGTISATATTTDSGTTSAIAMDVSQAQGGITLTNGGKIAGDVLLGDHDDTAALVADSDGDDTTTSTWTGALSFGAGNDTFAISGGGVFTGGISKTTGTLAITVDDGVLALGASNTASATTIDFGAASKLTLVLDPTLAPTPRLDATQSVTFATGATIEASVTEFVGTDFTAIVARAPTISASLTPGDIIFDNLPYLYAAETQIVSGAEQELDITLHLKSASDLGLNANQSAFYASVLDILAVDDNTLETPLLALSDAKSFAKAYEMLMPKTSQPTLHAALIAADDIERNLQGREGLFLTDPSFNGMNAWWAGTGRALSLDASALSQGIDGDIVSTTFGADYMFVPWAMVGAEVTFGGADLFDAGSQGDVVHVDSAQGGVYGSLAAGPLYISGSAGAGSTSNRSVRLFAADDFSSRIESAWDGTFLNAAGEVGVNAEFHHAIFRPWVGVSWLKLDEEAHQETTGGTGLDLSYDSIDAEVERARAGVTLAYNCVYPEVQLTPEFRAVWSQLLNTLPGTLRGSFVDGSVPFALGEAPIAHDQISAGFGFTLHGKGLAVSLGYDATLADGETSHTGKLAISTQF